MMTKYLVLPVAVLAILAVAVPNAKAACTITTYDATEIRNAQTECTDITINGIQVAAGETLDLTHLKDGTKVTFQGTITWGYQEWTGTLIQVAGTNIEITGSPGHVLDGRGALWWDGQGGNGGKDKPRFFRAQLTNSQIHKLNVKNTPRHSFSINGCQGVVIRDINIDNSAGDSAGGHNTDAFDVGDSTDVTIDNVTVFNQDDCLAVNSGTNIKFTNSFCSGGHGISIGSVGGRSNNVVKGVNVTNCQINNSENGVRIKTVSGATGSVRDILYQNITLSGIRNYGIVIRSDYLNGGPTGKPTGGVPITNLTVSDVHGTVDSSGANVFILVQNAADWHFSRISISGGTKKENCTGIPAGAGISC